MKNQAQSAKEENEMEYLATIHWWQWVGILLLIINGLIYLFLHFFKLKEDEQIKLNFLPFSFHLIILALSFILSPFDEFQKIHWIFYIIGIVFFSLSLFLTILMYGYEDNFNIITMVLLIACTSSIFNTMGLTPKLSKEQLAQKVALGFNKIEKDMKKISDLQNQISQKKSECLKLMGSYELEIDNLKSAILEQKQKYGLKTYQEAIQNQEIALNLSLIRQKQAYASTLGETIHNFEKGEVELRYLQEKANDNLRLMNVLSEKIADDLIKNIDDVLENHQPKDFNVNIDERTLKPTEKIWDEITK